MCQRIIYVLKRGDTLYSLAKKYNTTVPSIMVLNPMLNPRNLRIGRKIAICPNTNLFAGVSPIYAGGIYSNVPLQILGASNEEPPTNTITTAQLDLISDMRYVMARQIYWIKMAVISICENLDDQIYVVDKLAQSSADIAELYSKYYPANDARNVALILSEHFELVVDLIKAICSNNKDESSELHNRSYLNADEVARQFMEINPHYNYDSIRKMIYSNLDLTINEIVRRAAKNYPGEIAAFDNLEKDVLNLADYLAYGIMTQFPDKFE